MSTSAFKTVTMQIPEEISLDVRRQVVGFMQKRKAELAAELEALKETEKAIKAEDARNGSAPKLSGTGKRSSLVQVKERVLERLKDGVGCRINELAGQLGASYGTTYRAIDELSAECKVEKGDDGLVRLKEVAFEL